MKSLHRLACKFDLDQSHRKSAQVHERPGQTESQVNPGFQFASTCDSVWPGLNSVTGVSSGFVPLQQIRRSMRIEYNKLK